MGSTLNCLFFSRGRGHGHAIPDMAIAADLKTRAPELAITFASYATGAATFRSASVPVRDLELPEKNAYLATFFRAQELIDEVKPDVVIAHEEFAALAAARAAKRPSIFISAWLPERDAIAVESVAYADGVIVLGEAGVFVTPPDMRASPIYVGDVVRHLAYTRDDRARLRAELDIPADAFVVSVIPGGSATEEKVPIADNLLSAFARLALPAKALFWLSSSDYHFLAAKAARQPDVKIMKFYSPVEKFMALSDLIVTKGTRGATLEAASLGLPTLALSPGTNPIDDLLVPRIRSNTSLHAKAANDDVLLAYLEKFARERASPPAPLNLHRRGSSVAAIALADEVRRVTSRRAR